MYYRPYINSIKSGTWGKSTWKEKNERKEVREKCQYKS